MKITQKISPEKREEIILLFLKGTTKTEIVKTTGVSWWHVIATIHSFEIQINGNSETTENLEKIRNEELSLIRLAQSIADGQSKAFNEFDVRLNAFASADIMNYCVFIP